MDLIEIAISTGAGYFIGAISFAVIVARHHGVDILKEGSGNPGATNVKRSVGKKAGNLVFALDCLKGFVSALVPLLIFNEITTGIFGLLGAILGHSFSVFIKFKGGKGVATTMGGLLALAPWVVAIGMVCWLLCFYTTRYVSLASILFGVSLPVSGFALGMPMALNIFLAALAVLLVVRHISNIQRLIAGTESRFEKKKPKAKENTTA